MKWQAKNKNKKNKAGVWVYGQKSYVLCKEAKKISRSKIGLKKPLFLVGWRFLLEKKRCRVRIY